MDYAVYTGSTEYTADKLANIRLSRGLEGKGFYGVSTSSFSCDIYTEYPLSEGAVIKFSELMEYNFTVAEQSHSGHVASITAYDYCKNLDLPFDYSGYTQFDSDGKAIWYATSLIINGIANQCGFSSAVTGSPRMPELCYNDFAGKSCRQILIDLSKVNVGFWYDSGGVLNFRTFSPSVSGLNIADENRSELKILGKKTISGIFAEDEIYGKDYSTGSPWQNTERLSGRYLTAELVQQMTGQILSDGGSYDYFGWECPQILTYAIYNIGDCIAYEGNDLPVLNANFEFTAMGIIANLSSPAPDNSFSEYHDLYSRKLEGKVAYERVLGCTVTTQDGFGLVRSTEAVVNSG